MRLLRRHPTSDMADRSERITDLTKKALVEMQQLTLDLRDLAEKLENLPPLTEPAEGPDTNA